MYNEEFKKLKTYLRTIRSISVSIFISISVSMPVSVSIN